MPRICIPHLHFLLIAAILALRPIPAAQALGYLHRDHTYIVDGSGSPVQLRGLNLGGWLTFQDYMYGLPGSGDYVGADSDPKDPLPKLIALVGPENAQSFLTACRDNWITQPDIWQIKGWGFNSVRVPMDYRIFYDPASGRDIDTGFTYLDHLLAWCAAAKIYVILDMHAVPGGTYETFSGNVYSSPAKQALLESVMHF